MKLLALTAVFIFAVSGPVAFAHGGHHHGGEHEETESDSQPPKRSAEEVAAAIVRVAMLYQQNVHSIFQQKCFDCHTKNTKFPGYYSIPGIKHLMDRDIDKGRKRLDMTNGFPFAGHGTVRNHLNEIMEVLQEDCMPPFLYRTMHGARLTDDEKEAVRAWVEVGRREL